MGQNIPIAPEFHPSIIIKCKNLDKLKKAINEVQNHSINCYAIYEPLFNNEMTAFATAPLLETTQKLLKKDQFIKDHDICLKEV